MKIKNIKKKNYREVKTTQHVFFFFRFAQFPKEKCKHKYT